MIPILDKTEFFRLQRLVGPIDNDTANDLVSHLEAELPDSSYESIDVAMGSIELVIFSTGKQTKRLLVASNDARVRDDREAARAAVLDYFAEELGFEGDSEDQPLDLWLRDKATGRFVVGSAPANRQLPVLRRLETGLKSETGSELLSPTLRFSGLTGG
jgi:hypothetical protein